MEIDGLTYEMTLLEKVKHFKNEALKAIVNSDEDYKTKLEILCDNQILGYDYFHHKFKDFIIPFEKKLISFFEDLEELDDDNFDGIDTFNDKLSNNYIERRQIFSVFEYIDMIEDSINDIEMYSKIGKRFLDREKEWLEDFMENLYKEAFDFAIKNNIDSFQIDW